MFRIRLTAVVLSGGLMLFTGCMSLPQGGLFSRRCDPCCPSTCGDCGCTTSMPSTCGCGGSYGGTMISHAPIVPQDGQIIPSMPQAYPLPKISTTPNSPMVPYPGQ
jgi:hypothetical protein